MKQKSNSGIDKPGTFPGMLPRHVLSVHVLCLAPGCACLAVLLVLQYKPWVDIKPKCARALHLLVRAGSASMQCTCLCVLSLCLHVPFVFSLIWECLLIVNLSKRSKTLTNRKETQISGTSSCRLALGRHTELREDYQTHR